MLYKDVEFRTEKEIKTMKNPKLYKTSLKDKENISMDIINGLRAKV